MKNSSKITIGKTYFPKKANLEISDAVITGQGWKVEKLSDKYIFEFLAARHGGGVDRYELTKDEFDKVKAEVLSFDDLMEITDRNHNRHPIKKT